jgi:fibulin 1/2
VPLPIYIKFIILASFFFIESHGKYEDCEKPPEVEYASVVVKFDENEEFVTATYRCQDGFKLNGKTSITCELDTDEWQENPPTCEQGESERDKKF